MNAYSIFTLTRNKGLRVVAGATFKLVRLADGRHFIKSKQANAEGVIIDVSLLASSFAVVTHHTRQSSNDRSGFFTASEVTLSRFGLAQDADGTTVLVPPEESTVPYVAGLTGVCDPVLVWVPEDEVSPVYTGADNREQCWLMPGMVKILTMSDLWLNWCDPTDRMRPPESIKVETFNGQVHASNSSARDYNNRKAQSTLMPFKAERNRYRLPRPSEGHGVICY